MRTPASSTKHGEEEYEQMEPDESHGMTALDRKIADAFPGITVRKDLVSEVKGNALVPTYVLEYLLSNYAANTDEASIESGVKRVQQILTENYVHREEANLVQSKIRERGSYRIIDKVEVSLNDRLDQYEASFANLGISQVVVDAQTVKKYPKLLVTGIWCMCEVSYAYAAGEVPWRLERLSPVQMSRDDTANFTQQRTKFTDAEWIDLLMQSIGFNPALFSDRAKLWHLVRLVPFVERNYNLIELGPKGTGKSHIYSEFSPHGILISGGEVTVAKLFVNNATRRVGLVGYWDTVAFDEFAGRAKKAGKDLVAVMKNYMANKTFSRGTDMLQGEASMVFVGNTTHTVPYMLKNSDLFEELPAQYHDSAFLDRIHCYIPGWEFEQIRPEMFTNGFGFVVDYLAEILHSMRDMDYSTAYERYFTLSPTLTTRDKDGIRKTFSGLMKLVYPSGEATREQMEPLLRCAIEGRKRVKDQLCRIDQTMAPVEFTYLPVDASPDAEPVSVTILEEVDYPDLYRRGGRRAAGSIGAVPAAALGHGAHGADVSAAAAGGVAQTAAPAQSANDGDAGSPQQLTPVQRAAARAKETHRSFKAGQRGVSYDGLFGPYVAGATKIEILDTYVIHPYQIRNFAEFLDTVLRFKEPGTEVAVHLITQQADPEHALAQMQNLKEVKLLYRPYGIDLTCEFVEDVHDRHIKTDTGWWIVPGYGLDFFDKYDDGNWLNPQTRIQQFRRVRKDFDVTYQRLDR